MDDSFAIGFFFGCLIISLVLSTLIGRVAENRGRSFWFGFLVSFLLSPLFGVIIVLLATSDYRSDPLIGGHLSAEEYLRAEQLRLQLRRTELRWKMFSNLLYLSLFSAAAYFFYNHPEPLIRIRDAVFASHAAPATPSRPPGITDALDPVSLTLPPTPQPKQYRYYLTQPTRIQVKNGVLTIPARTEASLLQESSTALTVRAMGYEFQIQPSQVNRVAY